MRVLLVSLARAGGSSHYPIHLAKGLSAHSEVDLLVPEKSDGIRWVKDDVTLHSFPTSDITFPSIENIRAINTVRKIVSKVYPDVIHFPFYRSPNEILTALGGWKKASLITTLHDPHTHLGDQATVGDIDIGANLRVFGQRIFDKVVVHGDRTKSMAIDVGYDAERLEVIPHGLYDLFKQSEVTHDDDGVSLLYFGELRKNKAPDRLPDIINKVTKEVPDVSLTVAGSVPRDSAWSAELKQQLKAHDDITFRNEYIPNDDVQPLFEHASAVICPYRSTSTSGIVLLAYTFETPVVATDTGDMGMMIQQDGTGLIAEKNTPESIAETATVLLNNTEIRNKCIRNIQQVGDQYKWEEIGHETVEMYGTTL